MHSLLLEIRSSLRALSKRPGFAATAVLTLALGVGANTAMFSVVDALMFRRLPVQDADRLVSIVVRGRHAQFHRAMSFPDYQDYASLDVFRDATAFVPNAAQITAGGEPERATVTLTTGNYFSTLLLPSHRGRVYSAREGDPGGEAVVLLGFGYWQRRFGADPSIVGRTLSLNGHPVTVIGVTPEAFPGTVGFVETQLYVPLSVWERFRPEIRDSLADRAEWGWRVVGRLRPGVTLQQAAAAVSARATHLESEYPETHSGLRAFVFPEPRTRLEPAAADYLPIVSVVFMSIVGLVLLVACANVANLLLVRATGRSKELAIRAALGAGRLRILRQLIVESTLLSVMGGLAGFLLAIWVTDLLASVQVASDAPLHFDFSPDNRVFLFGTAVSLLVGVLAGLAPGIQASRTNLADAFREGWQQAPGPRQPLRSILVAAQIAVSLVLLICTGLFVQSLSNVSRMHPGFETKDRFMLSMDTGLRNYSEERARLFYQELLSAVRDLNGVESVALAFSVPIGYNNDARQVYLTGEGQGPAAEEREDRMILFNAVSPDYFSTLGIAILAGRPIKPEDRSDTRLVAVVNERMAQLFWPGTVALGQRFSMVGPEGPFVEIVGIAADGFYSIPGEPPQPHFYLPFSQHFRADQTLFVHSRAPMTAVLPEIRRRLAELDPSMPVFDTRTLRSHLEDGKAAILFRLPAALVSAFALIGIALAATGLYGVISYSVAQRTHEIGVRIALGATSAQILRLVSSQGFRLAAAGVLAGGAAPYLVTRTFADLLVGVGAADPVTYVAASLAILAAALLASFIPAHLRARRIDPVVALRGQ